jgi:anti-sigma regulatory factor (Ser/Thr protein kinase)
MTRRMTMLTVSAEVGALKDVFAFIRIGGDASELAAIEMERLDLIIEEIFMNIARHAYDAAGGSVDIGYAVEGPGRLAVEISDYGSEFNPLQSDPPDFSRGLADRPLGGMGIFLVKEMAGSLRYTRRHNRNTLGFLFSGAIRQEKC